MEYGDSLYLHHHRKGSLHLTLHAWEKLLVALDRKEGKEEARKERKKEGRERGGGREKRRKGRAGKMEGRGGRSII